MAAKVLLIAGCLLMARVAFAAPVTGFQAMDSGGKVTVAKILTGATSLGDLVPGDVIVKFNGAPIKTASAIDKIIATKKVGDKIPVVISRVGVQRRITIVINDSEKLKQAADELNRAKWHSATGQGVPTIDSNAPIDVQRRQRLNMKIR